jgi:hypothetical protein
MLSSRSAHQSSDIADPAATGLLKAEMINAPGSIDRPCKTKRDGSLATSAPRARRGWFSYRRPYWTFTMSLFRVPSCECFKFSLVGGGAAMSGFANAPTAPFAGVIPPSTSQVAPVT